MRNYVRHLEEMSTAQTFKRKKNYIDFNLRKYLENIGYKNTKFLEMGPGLGEFVSYLNDRGVSSIDIIDNDGNILEYVSKKYTIGKNFLSNNIISLDKKIGKYNFIFLMQVLEHIPKDQYVPCIQLLYKHLHRGGFLVIVVPNANNPLGLVERYGDLQHTGSFTEQSLRDLVNISDIEDEKIEIRGYEIPPYDPLNLLRIFLQKVLHLILLLIMIINGGIFFKTMTPNIMLVIRKNRFT